MKGCVVRDRSGLSRPATISHHLDLGTTLAPTWKPPTVGNRVLLTANGARRGHRTVRGQPSRARRSEWTPDSHINGPETRILYKTETGQWLLETDFSTCKAIQSFWPPDIYDLRSPAIRADVQVWGGERGQPGYETRKLQGIPRLPLQTQAWIPAAHLGGLRAPFPELRLLSLLRGEQCSAGRPHPGHCEAVPWKASTTGMQQASEPTNRLCPTSGAPSPYTLFPVTSAATFHPRNTKNASPRLRTRSLKQARLGVRGPAPRALRCAVWEGGADGRHVLCTAATGSWGPWEASHPP